MVSSLGGMLPRLAVDVVLVLLVVANGWVGWRTGSVRRLLSLVGVYAGFLAAYYTGNSVASIVRRGDLVANGWAFVAVLVAVVLVFEMLGAVFGDRLQRAAVLAFDRIAGMALGAALGVVEALAVFLVALAVGAASPGAGYVPSAGHDNVSNAVRAAALSSEVLRVEPVVRAAFAPIIGTDLVAHLESGSPAMAWRDRDALPHQRDQAPGVPGVLAVLRVRPREEALLET